MTRNEEPSAYCHEEPSADCKESPSMGSSAGLVTEPKIWLNAEPLLPSEGPASTSLHAMATDRGLNYGHGLFETIRVLPATNTQTFHLCFSALHFRRMWRGLARLGLLDERPYCSADDSMILRHPFLQLIQEEIATLDLSAGGVLRILITAGSGKRGYACSQPTSPRRFYAFSPHSPVQLQGDGHRQLVRVMISDHRLSHNTLLAGIKHLNRLEQVLAANEVQQAAFDDGLMCDQAGNLVESTSSNIFLVNNNRLITPEIKNCGVNGVLRSAILEAKSSGDKGLTAIVPDFPLASEGTVTLRDLWEADEVFLTNSVKGVRSITRVVDKTGAIHDFAVGPMTQHVQAWLAAVVEERRL